ncbi:2TM domain-containing protein [Spirosoma sp. KNUC1025]|uniref:2TM domain-containing protein n=1 Tax=Spirosoma sp. KNUC1025 TaxID=2894082 RepID=UPI003866EEA7|nr:2TM domain-containing protein [Spirosoma sp. KNUC1025]
MEPTQHTSAHDPYLWNRAKARVGFRIHLRTYLIVNAGLWLIWAFSSLAIHSFTRFSFIFPWPIFPMIGWGIGLASHYFHAYQQRSERSMIEEEYQRLVKQ